MLLAARGAAAVLAEDYRHARQRNPHRQHERSARFVADERALLVETVGVPAGRSRSYAFVVASPALGRGRRPRSNAARLSPNGLRLVEMEIVTPPRHPGEFPAQKLR